MRPRPSETFGTQAVKCCEQKHKSKYRFVAARAFRYNTLEFAGEAQVILCDAALEIKGLAGCLNAAGNRFLKVEHYPVNA